MLRGGRWALLGVTLSACGRSPPPGADSVAISYERRFADGASCVERLYLSGGRARLESCQTEPRSVVVLDPRRDGPVRVAPTPAAPPPSATASAFEAPKAELAKLLVDGTMAPPVLRETEVERQVAGIACRRYELVRGERVVGETCFADWDRSPVSRAAARALTLLDPQLDPDQLPGFPLMSAQLDADGRDVERTTVTAVVAGPQPDALFALPAE
ncbi:MAG: hypothetical protein U1F43_03140 [Myxococcota bacterium]